MRIPPEAVPQTEVVSEGITGKYNWDFVDQYLYFHEDGRITSNHREISGKWSSSTEGEYILNSLKMITSLNALLLSEIADSMSVIRVHIKAGSGGNCFKNYYPHRSAGLPGNQLFLTIKEFVKISVISGLYSSELHFVTFHFPESAAVIDNENPKEIISAQSVNSEFIFTVDNRLDFC